MVGPLADDPFFLEDFSISFEDDLPPLPWEEGQQQPAHPLLARRLWSLMCKAACHVIPPPGIRPDHSLTDEMEALSAAARYWRVGSVRLDERLWTGSGPYWRGEIARTLGAGPQDCAQGFLLVLARSVGRSALFQGRGAPLTICKGIQGQTAAQGPHLALVACEIHATGKAVASWGFTQPVVDAGCFMPVNSSFERDVLFLLRHVQVALDVHGIDCAITRPFDAISQAFTPCLQLSFGCEGATGHALLVEMSDRREPPRAPRDGSFILSPDRLGDGSFLDWIEVQIKTRLQMS